jgi:hypothetical protein
MTLPEAHFSTWMIGSRSRTSARDASRRASRSAKSASSSFFFAAVFSGGRLEDLPSSSELQALDAWRDFHPDQPSRLPNHPALRRIAVPCAGQLPGIPRSPLAMSYILKSRRQDSPRFPPPNLWKLSVTKAVTLGGEMLAARNPRISVAGPIYRVCGRGELNPHGLAATGS